MGKKGAGTGVNTKVQAAREKQAAVEGARAAKAQAAQEAAEAKEWSKGANQRGSKREDEAARKQEEKTSKLAAKKALQAEEAEQLSGFKSVVKTKKKVDVPPWEAALMSSSVSNKEKKRQEAAKRQAQAEEARKAKAERAEKEAKAMRDSGIQMGDDSELSGSANPNRKGADGGDGGDWASGIDAAIGSLSLEGAGPAERHPEKRLKAALAAYEERELPALKEEKPGLKLRQYKQMIFEQFQKSPENPVNKARAAEAAEAAAAAAKK
ncbi:conserved unknown protein [Ectocarpus siliculosus]|uniref:Uncharacterized protein n=1 Tax=Ectocarpus siliculosus TaxID=2880 RepID=D7G657_ECTSI|nr:conserved unknown protein [Ectocarpus siliculosus]|eukprot:CBJ27466.1 conserved unknown protein [Ectocarpus siliculosus]